MTKIEQIKHYLQDQKDNIEACGILVDKIEKGTKVSKTQLRVKQMALIKLAKEIRVTVSSL